MEKKFKPDESIVFQGPESQVETVKRVKEFPFEIFSCISGIDESRLKSFFVSQGIFIQFYKEGQWYEYGVGKEKICRLVIEDIEEFQIAFTELVIKIYKLPEQKRKWFELHLEYFDFSVFVTVFSSATVKDFSSPVEFFKKWEFLLSDVTFENMKEKYFLEAGMSLEVFQEMCEKGIESPEEFRFQLQNSEGVIDLPVVRFGKMTEREVTIFSVQDQSINGVNEGEARKLYNENWLDTFQNVCRVVEENRNSYSEEEFKQVFCDYDNFISKYEWFLKFFEYLYQCNDDIKKEHPLNKVLKNSKLRMFAQAKTVETSFQERREKRKKLNKYLNGFSGGNGSIASAHIISFVTTILICASRGVEIVSLPTDYPLRKHFDESEENRGVVDTRIFNQKNVLVRSLCKNFSGVLLQSEPDIEPFFRIQIKKEELECHKFPFLQRLIDEIVKK